MRLSREADDFIDHIGSVFWESLRALCCGKGDWSRLTRLTRD